MYFYDVTPQQRSIPPTWRRHVFQTEWRNRHFMYMIVSGNSQTKPVQTFLNSEIDDVSTFPVEFLAVRARSRCASRLHNTKTSHLRTNTSSVRHIVTESRETHEVNFVAVGCGATSLSTTHPHLPPATVTVIVMVSWYGIFYYIFASFRPYISDPPYSGP